MSGVPDASLLSRALIPTQRLATAASVLAQLMASDRPMVAPVTLQGEFRSAVRRLERAGALANSRADSLIQFFEVMPLIFLWSDAWARRATELARQFNQSTIYDSIYLACAESLGLDFYTCDVRFAAALGTVGSPRVHLVS